MTASRKTRLVAAGGGLAALVLAAGALAQTDTFSPKEESDALVANAAELLGVEPVELTDALRQAFENRIDAAVADGRMTEEQAERMREHLESGDLPLLHGPWGGHGPRDGMGLHHGFGGGLDAAAETLGLSQDELRDALRDGDRSPTSPRSRACPSTTSSARWSTPRAPTWTRRSRTAA